MNGTSVKAYRFDFTYSALPRPGAVGLALPAGAWCGRACTSCRGLHFLPVILPLASRMRKG